MGRKKDLQIEQMLELLPDGVVLIDTATGLPLRFNEKAHTQLGYTQEEFAKLTISDYEAKEDPQQTQAHIQKILANKRDDFETQHRSKHGDILDMRVTVILLQTDSDPHLLCVFRDITPQKQLERQVQKEKEAVNFILEETVGGYWDWDLKNNTEYLSPGLKKMLGYEDHELPNAPQSWMKLIFKTDLDTTMQNYDAHVQSKGRIPFSQEVRYRHKDGSIVWIICSGKVIEWDDKDNPVRMVGSHIDITHQKQLQQQLQESQQRFSDVAKASGEYIWELDANGKYNFLTKPFEDMLGYNIQESLGQTPFSFMPESEAKRVEEYFAKEVTAKESAFTNLIHKSVSKEGHTIWQKVNGLPMYDREGNLTGYRGAALDITKEKAAQDELESAKKRLEVTIKAAKIGLWEFNLQTGYVYWDRYAYEMLGYSDQEFAMSYEKWKELIHPRDLEEAQQKLQTQIEQKNAFILEFRFKRKDGSWSWIEGRGEVTRYDQDKKPLKMAGIHIDKNSQKQIEHSLDEAKQKAEAASEAKTQFLANMSHEIRTPMNAIIGLGDVLYDQMNDEKQKDILSKINNSSKMLLGIINDILDYSKIEAGKLELEDTEFDLESILSQLKVMFEHKASQKGIELYFHLKGRLPALVYGDQLRLTQVLTNLLSNSIKFTEKGNVTLSIAPDSFEDEGTALVDFSVTDTGIGMSQSQLDKLFQPFTQADTSTTRKYGGTGLGLVIAQNIVKAFGSRIHVTS
ncbi:MAG: PAS domain-containing sensor histidine kinase, partial [Campylobacterota bacterium]